MTAKYTIPLGDTRATWEAVGGKGAALAQMIRAGLPVPDGFHVTTAAYQAFVAANGLQPTILTALQDAHPDHPPYLEAASRTITHLFSLGHIPPEVASAITAAYSSLPGPEPPVAVRSSATAEDLPLASFAGQQDTFLNIAGTDALLDAVQRCWASLWTARAIGYRARHHISPQGLSLAVVVQRLVPARAAGILFTANPLTGRRNEATISAAWGLGESIVGGQVTPDAYILDKDAGQVLQREIAEKQVMTVRVEGGTEVRPVPQELRSAPVLDDAQAAELVRWGVQIEALFGRPMDIEWALADGDFAILQARPITALPEPAAAADVPPPAEWEVPNPRGRYLRNNIVELMPDPLTPLFATLGRRTINRSMKRTVDAFLGGLDIIPQEVIVTIHGYAYYNGDFTTRQILRILWHSVGIARRMFSGMEARWLDARQRYAQSVHEWEAQDWRALSTGDILRAVPQVFGAAIEYYIALLGGVVPAAWITEGLFTAIYTRLIPRENDPPAATYLLGFDSRPIRAEKALYDLAHWAREHTDLAAHLLHRTAHQFAAPAAAPPWDVDQRVWREWQHRFQAYLDQYAHTIYDLDFAKPTPADDPTPVAQTLKLFLSGQGADPYARQQAMAERREEATQAMLNRLGGLRRRLFRTTLARAQRYAPRREDGLADIGLGYPLVRQMLLEVGRRLAEAGAIEKGDDILWLVEDEAARAVAALADGAPVDGMDDRVGERKALWRARKQITPPASLPLPPRWLRRLLPGQFGIEVDGSEGPASSIIRGIPCSPGRVTAPARVLHGPEDFDQMAPEDVLVAAITTPAWTTLFAMASGIVTDVGGPLSHGSIVAREYGIPAVLGTGVATQRIVSGQRVTVDGDAGTVSLEGA